MTGSLYVDEMTLLHQADEVNFARKIGWNFASSS